MPRTKITDQRKIIDRKKVAAALELLAEAQGPQSPELRRDLLAALRQALDDGRREIKSRFEVGASGRATVYAYGFLIDQLLRLLFDLVVHKIYRADNPTKAERLCLIAVGGYGRGELAPQSDIDLLFLLPYKQTPWGEQVVEYMLYILWDLGLKVGHASRTVAGCLNYAKKDLSIRTGLLEARYIWGERELFDDLKAGFAKAIVAGKGPEFIDAKLDERDRRHRRFGESRYLVEPHIKEGKGGLRDLHTLFWIAKFLYPITRIGELVNHDVLTQAEVRTFAKAEEFLWRVRCHLHYLTGRPEERLTFDMQPALAQKLGYEDKAGISATERFMKAYFRNAKNVGSLTRIFCAFLEEKHRRRPRFRLPRFGLRRREMEGFLIEGDRVNLRREDDFKRDPVKLIRLFHLAQAHDFDIHPRALTVMTRNLGLIDDSLRANEEANRLFLEILTSTKAPDVSLRRMNEAGVLGRFMPDFGRIVSQMQHDMYHVYTVDEHAIQAIGLLARIENGSLAEDHPVANEIIHKVLSREVLYMATFLHDIAKGRKGDHSVLGAEVANQVCPRFGFSEGETETVAWLVRYHLYMSGFAFKRDLSDPKTVTDFAAIVQSPERLRLLLVLTVADIRAVGPGVWNGWKGQLLRELYYQAEAVLLGGVGGVAVKERVAAAQEALRERLSTWAADTLAAYVARHFPPYWLSADTELHEYHARLVDQADRDGAPLTLKTRVDTFRDVTEVTLYTADHPGLFARIAGAMALCGANIVDARISTTTDGMALDGFWIQDAGQRAFARPEKLARLGALIEQTLSGRVRPHEKLQEAPSLPTRTSVFTVAPRVLVDNTASDSHTLIEVNGRDQPGFLSRVTYELFQLSLTISSARISTYGERAVDVFYVRDMFGLKITSEAKIRIIEKRLFAALEELAGEGAEDLKPPAGGGLANRTAAAQ